MREVRQQTDYGTEKFKTKASHFALQVAQIFQRPSEETKAICCIETFIDNNRSQYSNYFGMCTLTK